MGTLSSPADGDGPALSAIQRIFNPYIRSREEASHIRRVLALHLKSCIQSDSSASRPLALIQAQGATASQEVLGLQREYIRALNANLKAWSEHNAIRREFTARLNPQLSKNANHDPSSSVIRLEAHLTNIKLRQKHARLQTIERSLDQLARTPAAQPSFLSPKDIFRDAQPLPAMPKEVLNGAVRNHAAPETDLDALIHQLGKQVLRAQLLLKHEEELLDKVGAPPQGSLTEAKAYALNATRTELIAWMERELGKASAEGDAEGEGGEEVVRRCAGQGGSIEEQLGPIREMYATYVAARRALVQMAGQPPDEFLSALEAPSMEPTKVSTLPTMTTTASASPRTAQILPQITSLLTLSHHQKSLIATKSHLAASLAKRLTQNTQTLDHVANESHLLPDHSQVQPSSLQNALTPVAAATRVRPWVFAADEAKIATLELVAEQIEEGQVALEKTMGTLREMYEMLGKKDVEGGSEDGEDDGGEEDIWLAEDDKGGGRVHDETVRGSALPRRQHRGKDKKVVGAKGIGKGSKEEGVVTGDIWALLDGNLGLLGAGDDVRT